MWRLFCHFFFFFFFFFFFCSSHFILLVNREGCVRHCGIFFIIFTYFVFIQENSQTDLFQHEIFQSTDHLEIQEKSKAEKKQTQFC